MPESSPSYSFVNRSLGKRTVFQRGAVNVLNDNKEADPKQEGALADTIVPRGGQTEFNVVRNYRWTLSKVTGEEQAEIPYIRLLEHKVIDTTIQRQFSFYTQLAENTLVNTLGGTTTFKSSLNVYNDIWPKNPTGFSYKFPYFNKTNMELGTEPWAALDSVGDSIKNAASGIGKLLNIDKFGESVGKGLDLIKAGTNLAQNLQYPAVGVADRPKIFMAHQDRTINISFTLYNTFDVKDWKNNRELLYTLMSQNLFNKRDYTTGLPPVFYEVWIPGQYYCVACCATNIKIENLGNQRLLEGNIVPDAYQVELTLTELVKPSKNQFQALQNGEANSRINAR